MDKNIQYKRILRINFIFYVFLILMVSSVFGIFFIHDYYTKVNETLLVVEKNLIQEEKKKTKQKVEKLITQVELYKTFLQKNKHTYKDINVLLLKFIKSFSSNINDYIFVFDSNGNQLVHFNSKYEGLNRINLKDENGIFIIKELIQTAKLFKGGFLKYSSTTGLSGISKDKISYATYFKSNDWIIGSGVYLDHLTGLVSKEQDILKKNLDNQIKVYISYSILFVFIFLIIGYFLYKYIENLLEYYKRIIQEKNDKLKELNKVISSKVVEVKEDNKKKDILLFKKLKQTFMGELLNNIAHQWRQPLNEIMAYSSITIYNFKNGKLNDKELQENLTNIVETTSYLSQTIEDFRSFCLSDNDKEFKNIDKIFNQAINLFDPIVKKHGIQIIIKNNAKEVFILSSFLQVLLNLLNNSKDAFINNKVNNKIIYIKSEIIDGVVIVSYVDNAGGIEEEVQDRIFEPYFTTKDDSQGIGLYMTYQILTTHMKSTICVSNKRFTLQSKHHIGACFDIKIKEFYE